MLTYDPNTGGDLPGVGEVVEYTPVTDISWTRGDDGEWVGTYSQTDSSGAVDSATFDNSYWAGPTEEDMMHMFGPGGGATAPTSNGNSENTSLLKWLEEHKNVAGMAASLGGGLLKNIMQAQMMEDQRKWTEEQTAKKLKNTDERRAYGAVKKMNTGLLGALQKQRELEGAKA